MTNLTAQGVRELLDYNPLTGVFYWQETCGGRQRGTVAGSPHVHGYIRISVDGRQYLAHRLAWLWMKGEWPEDEIDHCNCIRSDNRWTNLRSATRTQNRANSRPMPGNPSELKGVYKQTKGKKWRAQICHGGKSIHLGSFNDPEKASLAYLAAAKRIYGEFARLK